jgi:DNA segregation ATPase FtsK/SpoIIIE-like protein
VVAWLAEVEIPRRRAVANEKARELGTRWDARRAYIEDIREGRVPLLKPLVVIVDEFAQITLARDDNSKRFQEAVKEIAQLSRAYLVHLILATQRPDAQVVPPLIKANAPSRIALKLPALGDSITILAEKGAESLAGKGDLILKPIEGESIRLQGFSD